MTAIVASASAATAPRYTSYPTAPHFHAGITAADYAEWLAALPTSARVSVYLHIPYCDSLCWFCGCHTKHTLRYEPIAAYLDDATREIECLASHLPADARITYMHWGGGSPSLLRPADIARLRQLLDTRIGFASDAQFNVEFDPRDGGDDVISAFVDAGLTRASLGVQDFDPAVQRAINRHQSLAETRALIDQLRRAGIDSINIDAIYGLPHQTVASVESTCSQIVDLEPSRIAVFGYAHVPWMKPHQRLIDDAFLPGPRDRLDQAEAAARVFTAAGYRRIGMDHFARADDVLTRAAKQGRLRRNFQGYSDDQADCILGIGASAIGRLPQGYVQNETAIARYRQKARDHGFATARGIAFTQDDIVRGYVIERLMCDFAVDRADLVARFGAAGAALFAEARSIADGETATCDDTRFCITDDGRPLVRLVCARFDAWAGKGAARFSQAV